MQIEAGCWSCWPADYFLRTAILSQKETAWCNRTQTWQPSRWIQVHLQAIWIRLPRRRKPKPGDYHADNCRVVADCERMSALANPKSRTVSGCFPTKPAKATSTTKMRWADVAFGHPGCAPNRRQVLLVRTRKISILSVQFAEISGARFFDVEKSKLGWAIMRTPTKDTRPASTSRISQKTLKFQYESQISRRGAKSLIAVASANGRYWYESIDTKRSGSKLRRGIQGLMVYSIDRRLPQNRWFYKLSTRHVFRLRREHNAEYSGIEDR